MLWWEIKYQKTRGPSVSQVMTVTTAIGIYQVAVEGKTQKQKMYKGSSQNWQFDIGVFPDYLVKAS